MHLSPAHPFDHAVEMIDDKIKEFSLASDGTGRPTSHHKQHLLLDKTAVREIENEGQNQFSKFPELNSETEILCGNKRPRPDSVINSNYPVITTNCAIDYHMYPHTKAKLEQTKTKACNVGKTGSSPQSKQLVINKQEPFIPNNQLWEPKFPCFPTFSPMLLPCQTNSFNGPSVPWPQNHHFAHPTNEPVSLALSYNASDSNWNERFLRLQFFIKQCDESCREDYIKMLRSLNEAGRMIHANKMMERALYLWLEEGKELQRMSALNIHIPTNNEVPANLLDSLQ